MSTLALSAATTMNIAGSGNLTISSAITGAFAVTKSGAGELVLSGANTFTGGATVNAGTLTLSGTNSFNTAARRVTVNAGTLNVSSATAFGTAGTGHLTLAAGSTLVLNTATLSLNTLSVTGNSTIDFAGSNTLNLTNFSISAGATLTIANWTGGSDFFSTVNWTGATKDLENAAPMNQVSFTGFSGLPTAWQSADNEITPVPEPSAYGALLVGGLGTAFWWRRRRAAAKA